MLKVWNSLTLSSSVLSTLLLVGPLDFIRCLHRADIYKLCWFASTGVSISMYRSR